MFYSFTIYNILPLTFTFNLYLPGFFELKAWEYLKNSKDISCFPKMKKSRKCSSSTILLSVVFIAKVGDYEKSIVFYSFYLELFISYCVCVFTMLETVSSKAAKANILFNQVCEIIPLAWVSIRSTFFAWELAGILCLSWNVGSTSSFILRYVANKKKRLGTLYRRRMAVGAN